MRLMLIAPHQDDEILSAGGLIQQYTNQKKDIFVLFATNGDRFGANVARQRYEESCYALAELDIPRKHIFYMGYGDTGMAPTRSFLFRLLSAPANQVLSSYVSTNTYHPAGGKTIHALRTGVDGPMSRFAFLSDLTWAIQEISPDYIVCPSIWDAHGDHAALAILLHDILPVSISGASYLIHGGDDMCWPNRDANFFQKPAHLPDDVWCQRITVKLSNEQMDRKSHLIKQFSTQMSNDTSGFLLSFAKKEEVFFPWNGAIPQQK